MSVCIYVAIVAINLILGIKESFYPINKLKGRKFKIVSACSFVGVYLLMSGYRNYSGLSNDLSNNEYEFKTFLNSSTTIYESGYSFLMKIGSFFTKDYYNWRNIIIFVGLFILFACIYKFCSNPHLVISLFSVYLIILSTEQLRNFAALSIFMIGLCVYLFSDNRKKLLVYVVCTCLAGLVHSLFFIYLILILINHKFSKKAIKRIVGLVLLFCVVIFLNGNTIPGLSVLLNYIAQGRAALYLNQHTRFGFLYPMLLHISSVFISWLAYRNHTGQEQIYENILKMNLLMMVCFPLYMLQVSFYRIARNLLLVTYMAQAESMVDQEIVLSKKMTILICLIFSVALWIYIDLYITTPSEALLTPFFEYNFYFSS